MDQESRAKNELFKQKKRVDMELNELQSQLEGSGKESAGLVKTVKKLQLQCRVSDSRPSVFSRDLECN